MKIKLFSLIILFKIIFLSLNFASASNHFSIYFVELKKNSLSTGFYNIYAKRWNAYIKDKYEDTTCKSLPASRTYLSDYTNCTYRFVKKYMGFHKVNIKDVVESEHGVYLDLMTAAGAAERTCSGWDERGCKRAQEDFWNFWGDKYSSNNKYLKKVWTKYANQKQLEADIRTNNRAKEKKELRVQKEKKKKRESLLRNSWWIIVLLIIISFSLYLYTVPKNIKINKKKDSGLRKTFIEFWQGKISYGYSYWVGLTLVGTLISIPAIILTEESLNKLSDTQIVFFLTYIIFNLMSKIYLIVGTWRSAEYYKLEKKRKKQSLIWGYVGQFTIVLSIIKMLAESFL